MLKKSIIKAFYPPLPGGDEGVGKYIYYDNIFIKS
jgi:hypothetical protein